MLDTIVSILIMIIVLVFLEIYVEEKFQFISQNNKAQS